MSIASVALLFPRNTPLPALHAAVESGNAAQVDLRLQAGDSVDLRVNGSAGWPDGATALMIAAQNGDAALVRILLDHGADIGLANAHGESAIHVAEGETLEVLLERGANVNARTTFGQTPLMRAAIRARKDGDLNAVKRLIRAGADVKARDNQGLTAIGVLETWPDPDPEAIGVLRDAGGT